MATTRGSDDSGLPVLSTIAREISVGAIGRPIGELQAKRTARKNLKRTPSLFDGRSTRERWAFHVGGLTELQFNIGFEEIDDKDIFRHGIAFSLQPNINVPDVSILESRIRKFNRYLDEHPNAYDDLSMWYFMDGDRSANFAPAPIADNLIKQHVFIMLGATCPVDAISVGAILDDFDRLLPLYDYVEGDTGLATRRTGMARNFEWSPGNKARVAHVRYEKPERNIDAVQRHSKLQDALFFHLERMHGKDNVSGEQHCGDRTCIDVAVRHDSRYIYYEIKTALSARSCIRQGFGQLMEYAYWPDGQDIERLVIVGEAPRDEDANSYLEMLRNKFALPLAYEQFDPKTGGLVA